MRGFPPVSLTPGLTLSPRCDIWAARTRRRLGWDKTVAARGPHHHLPVPGQFFELDVYHSDGTPLTSDQIFVQLEKIWNSSLQTNKEPVGILTSNHRNSWAKAYNTLIKGASGGWAGEARPPAQPLPAPGPGPL